MPTNTPSHQTSKGYLQQALKLFEQGEYKKSLELFSHYLTYYPDDLGALAGVAGMLYEANRYEKAYPLAQKALQLAPENLHVLKLYVLIALKLHLFQDIHEILEKLYKKYQDNTLFLEICLSYHTATGDKEHILALVPKILHKTNQTPNILNQVGTSIESTGNIISAIKHLRKGLQLLLEQSCPPPRHEQKIMDKTETHKAILYTKRTLDELRIPFCLGHGTLLGIYRDGDLLSATDDIDLYLPWSVDRKWLEKNFKERGYKSGHYDDISWQWTANFRTPPEYTSMHAVEFSFLKPESDHLLMGFTRGDKVIQLQCSKFAFDTIKFLGASFMIPSPTEQHLQEIYGKEWNQRIRNRNFFIVGEHIIDPHHIRISYALNYILRGILNGEHKKAHGLALQLLSIYDDPLVQQVCRWLEDANKNIKWHPPLPYKQERISYRLFI